MPRLNILKSLDPSSAEASLHALPTVNREPLNPEPEESFAFKQPDFVRRQIPPASRFEAAQPQVADGHPF